MRPLVHQIIVGYASDGKATGTVSLIQEGPLRVLVDCGDPWNGGEIISQLMSVNTTCSEVTHVVITHGHIDHCANVNLFKNAQIFMALDYVGPDGIYSTISKEKGFTISDNIKIEVHKGHTSIDLIVKVENTRDGTVVISGDLFESEKDEGKWQMLTEYQESQVNSRDYILNVADVIIPGHGPLFYVNK